MVGALLGWAIAGTGNIARRFAEDMRLSRRGRVVAVASGVPERARALAAAIGDDVVHGTIDAVADLPGVDAVYIAGRNEEHVRIALRCLAAGKPVMVEKPFAATSAQARNIVAAARATNLLAMEAMWMRFLPAIRKLDTIVRSGGIGRMRSIDASLSFDNPNPPESVLFDLGVYPVSLTVQLLGSPRTIMASSTEDGRQSALVLTFPEAIATLSCGFAVQGENRAVVAGTSGLVSTDGPLFAPTMLTVRRSATVAAVGEEFGLAPVSRMPWRDSVRSMLQPLRARRLPIPYRGNGLHYQADHFAECLAAGLKESPVMPLAESVEVIRIVSEAAQMVKSQSAGGSGSKVESGL